MQGQEYETGRRRQEHGPAGVRLWKADTLAHDWEAETSTRLGGRGTSTRLGGKGRETSTRLGGRGISTRLGGRGKNKARSWEVEVATTV